MSPSGIASAGAIAIPGLNLVVSGYLISALAGLGAGAATGGLIGALVGTGFEENEATFYENEIKEGNILLAVKTRDDEQKKQVKEILNETDAYSFSSESMPDGHTDLKSRATSLY